MGGTNSRKGGRSLSVQSNILGRRATEPGTEDRTIGSSGWREAVRDAGAGFSLANLCYFRVWSEILTYTPQNTFLMKSPPGRLEFIGVTLNVVLGGILLTLLFRKVRRSTARRWPGPFQWLLLAVLLLPANGIRAVMASHFPMFGGALIGVTGDRAMLFLGVLVALGLTVFLLLAHRKMVRMTRAASLALLPMLPLTLLQGSWKLRHWDPDPFLDKPLAARLAMKPGAPRVVWLIFDELDYHLTFAHRPPGLPLNELDRLRSETLSAEQAVSPSSATLWSIPSLLAGKFATSVQPVDQDEAMVRFDGEPRTLLGSTPTVFYRARADGFNTGAAGWYLPYCRIFNDALSNCFWEDMRRQFNSVGSTLGEIMPNQTRSLLETSLLSPFGQSLTVQQRVRNYFRLLDQARSMATDPGLGLVFVHFSVPHSPHPFDRSTRQFTLANSPIRGYLDSLVLADITLGDIRRAMEQAGLWDQTTVLVSSDHQYRQLAAIGESRDLRIPFLLKLAGHSEAIRYERSFNTVLSHDLIIEILEGRLRTPEEVVHWLDARPAQAPPRPR